MELPKWAIRAQAIWLLIGTLLATLGAQGIDIPEWSLQIFAQEFIDILMVAVGSVIGFLQFVRAIFAAKEPGAEVKVLSAGDKRKYMYNPFKIAA